MEKHKLEFKDKQSLPMYLNQSFVRGPGIIVKEINKRDPPINNITEYYKNGTIKFEVNTENFLDPFSLFLELTIENKSGFPIKLDNSIHSLIKKIEVRYKKNNKILEKIDDYDIMSSLYFDLHLSRKERKERKENEGFGCNEYGSDETVIPPAGVVENPVNIDNDNRNPQFQPSAAGLALDTEYYTKLIPEISEWNYVKNGVIYPFDKNRDLLEPNKKVFKIPLMLRLLGHGIQPDNFKYIPMKIIGPIYINIVLNPHAFFRPFSINKRSFLIDPQTYVLGHLNAFERDAINYRVINVSLNYQLLQFDQKIENEIYAQVKNNSWYLDYIGLAYINHFYVFPLPCQDGISEFREQTEIRAMHIFFLTNLYEKSNYSRPLARHNKCIKRIELIWNNITIPEVIVDRNSLNTDKFEDNLLETNNADYFWNQLKKSFEDVNYNEKDKSTQRVLSKKNFCVKNSLSELVALQDVINSGIVEQIANFDRNFIFFNPNDITRYINQSEKISQSKFDNLNGINDYNFPDGYNELFLGDMEDIQNKSIYTFNFDSMPYSYKQFRNGIKINENDKFKIRVTRSDNFLDDDVLSKVQNVYSYMYVYVEYYDTVLLTSDGEFISAK